MSFRISKLDSLVRRCQEAAHQPSSPTPVYNATRRTQLRATKSRLVCFVMLSRKSAPTHIIRPSVVLELFTSVKWKIQLAQPSSTNGMRNLSNFNETPWLVARGPVLRNRPSNIQFDLLIAAKLVKRVRSVASPGETLVMISGNVHMFKALSQPSPKIQTCSN